MTSQTKKVHFDKDGSGNIVFSIHIIARTTRKEICGDTSAALRGYTSKDPDYGTIGKMRMQRLVTFNRRYLQQKRWQTLRKIFTALKPINPKARCTICQRRRPKRFLTPPNPWCGPHCISSADCLGGFVHAAAAPPMFAQYNPWHCVDFQPSAPPFLQFTVEDLDTF